MLLKILMKTALRSEVILGFRTFNRHFLLVMIHFYI